MFCLNQPVVWNDCPSYCSGFASTRIRGISPCGQFVLLSWIRHPVEIAHVSPTEQASIDLAKYRPIEINQWGEDGIDKATGLNLQQWIIEYERRRSD